MFEGRFNKIILFCIFFTIFVSSWILFKYPAEFYIGYLLFVVLIPVFVSKFGLPKWTILFAFFFFFGVYNILEGNNTVDLFLKVFIGLFLSYLFYYYVLVNYDFQIEKLFKFYLKGAYVVSVIGLIQFISYQVGFSPGYDYSWILNKWGIVQGGNFGIRVNSVFPEPTHYAAFMSSAFFIAIYDLINLKSPYYYPKLQAILIIAIYLLAFSGLGYASIILILLMFFINYGLVRYILIAIPAILLLFNFVYENVLEFKLRTDSTIEVFSTGQFAVGITHGSSITLYNNFYITVQNFKSNFLFGTGLGSHPMASEKYSLTKDIETLGFQLNYADANSMFLRIASETGLFGMILVLWILFKCYIKKSDNNPGSNHWLVSNAIFVLILLNFFRQGHYFLNGFPFFIWLYIYNYFDYKNSISESLKNKSTPEILVQTKT